MQINKLTLLTSPFPCLILAPVVNQHGDANMKLRLTKDQRKALEAYEFAERQEDRYMGSVFVNPIGQRDHEAKTRAAYENCLRLGMTHEHGL